MAVTLAVTIRPYPPPHKASALNSTTHLKTAVVQKAEPAPAEPVVAPATPTPDPAPAEVPAPPVVAPVYTPPSPTVGCGSDPNMAYIYEHESGCRTNAVNPSSGAYGLCQALPGSKMAVTGGDWQTNWDTQNSWCVSYALQRYGSTYSAYLFWVNNHWW